MFGLELAEPYWDGDGWNGEDCEGCEYAKNNGAACMNQCMEPTTTTPLGLRYLAGTSYSASKNF